MRNVKFLYMKKVLLSVICILPLLTFGQGKKLVWFDEFNYEGHPDPEKWSYENGFVRHREAQYYTKNRYANARVENGNLIITAIKEEPLELIAGGGGGFITQNSGGEFTSASLITENIFEFQTGRLEVRAKVPKGRGVWPAIWTLGTNIGYGPGDSRTYSEIDIMEYVGWNEHSISGCAHFSPRYEGYSDLEGRCRKITVQKPWENFHVYAIDWYDDRIEYHFDDTNYLTLYKKNVKEGFWPFDVSQYLIINLAIGGTWGIERGIDYSIFPAEFRVDYVRYYQWE